MSKQDNNEVIIIGHTNPDTDTVISAIAMAELLTASPKYPGTYTPKISGAINTETAFVCETFDLPLPEIVQDLHGQAVFLVDHNEESQRVSGATDENVVGIVDHHKMMVSFSHPIDIVTRPWGSTCTIMYDLFKQEGIELPHHLVGPMLSAIISDTVILRSPTTTTHDKQVVEELSRILDINYQELGMEQFKAKAQIAEKTAEQIIHNDFKVFEFSDKVVGVGQIETPDISEIQPKQQDIIATMETLKNENNYHSMILMVTDILEEGSQLLVVSDEIDHIAGMFDTTITDNISAFIPGMMSRKKQVAPVLNSNL